MAMRCSGYEPIDGMSRRQLLGKFGLGLGGFAAAGLLGRSATAGGSSGGCFVCAAPHTPRPSGSFFSSSPAVRRKWTSSITSPS